MSPSKISRELLVNISHAFSIRGRVSFLALNSLFNCTNIKIIPLTLLPWHFPNYTTFVCCKRQSHNIYIFISTVVDQVMPLILDCFGRLNGPDSWYGKLTFSPCLLALVFMPVAAEHVSFHSALSPQHCPSGKQPSLNNTN